MSAANIRYIVERACRFFLSIQYQARVLGYLKVTVEILISWQLLFQPQTSLCDISYSNLC